MTAILQIGICPIFVKLASHMLHLKGFICSCTEAISPKKSDTVNLKSVLNYQYKINIMLPDSANVIEDRN